MEALQSSSPTRRRLGVALVVALAAWIAIAVAHAPHLLTDHLRADQVPHSAGLVLHSWAQTFLTPVFWVFLALVLVLERRVPARPNEGTLSVGAAQDLVWFILFAVFELTVVRSYYVLLGAVGTQYFGGPIVDLTSSLGSAGAIAFTFVVIDLLLWLSHYTRHRVPTLWRFHVIHHSQRSLNIFTDSRTHFGEAVVTATIVFVPAVLLGLRLEHVIVLATAMIFYQRFFHANIRTNLGPLRYVLVTPQSHRIHHSIDPAHHDTNFGVILSVWDRMFRTGHADVTTYPATGLADEDVPVETSASPGALIGTYVRQLAYPLKPARRYDDRSAEPTALPTRRSPTRTASRAPLARSAEFAISRHRRGSATG